MFSAQRGSRLVLSVTALLVLAISSAVVLAGVDDLVPVKDKKGKKTGIYEKLIVRDSGVNLCRTPDGKGANLVDPFEIFLRHKDAPKNGYVRVADGDGKPVGWIKEEGLLNWNTRFALDPNDPQPDGTALEITRKDGLKMKWSGVLDPGKAAIVPILEEPGTERNPTYTVALFTAVSKGQAPVAAKPAAGGGEIDFGETKLEICFVIDTTNSMDPLINGTKEVVRLAAEAINATPSIAGRVKFGLVEYRDSTPAIAFAGKPAKVTTPIGPVGDLIKILHAVTSAQAGSEDSEEDVLAGLLMAIESAGWSKNSSKHIILLGDASAHLVGPKNTTGLEIGAIISRAEQRVGTEIGQGIGTITIHAVRAIQDYPAAELAKSREQFQTLAANGGRFQGHFSDMDAIDPASKAETVAALTKLLTDGFEQLPGGSKGGSTSTDPPEPTTPIAIAVWTLQNKAGGKGGTTVRAVEHGTATIRSADGDLLARKQLYVSQKDLRRLRSTLDLLLVELSDRADPADRGDVGALLKRLKTALVVGASGQKQELLEDTPLETVISNLPLKTDVLKTSVKALAQKDKESFEKWLAGLDGAKKRAQDLLEKQAGDWFPVGLKGKYTYVLLQEMP